METWQSVPFLKGYEASDEGKIRSIYRELHPSTNKAGYKYISARDGDRRTTFLVHRLVAAAFFGPSELMINHIDGCKTNNKLSNLEYCTAKHNGKTSNENVLKIKELREQGYSCKEIGLEFNLCESHVRSIINGTRRKRAKDYRNEA